MVVVRRFLYRSCLIVLLAFSVWAAGFCWFVARVPTTVEDENSVTDAIVVLTGGRGRLLAGINLLAEGKADKLLISGVGEKSTISDLQNLSEELSAVQVKPLEGRIVLGHMAYSTQTNAIEAAIWMELQHYKSLRLVTANYHIPRSMAQFEAEMPGVHIIPHPVFPASVKLGAWWKFPGSARLLVSEYTKFLAVKLAIILNLHLAPIPKSH